MQQDDILHLIVKSSSGGSSSLPRLLRVAEEQLPTNIIPHKLK